MKEEKSRPAVLPQKPWHLAGPYSFAVLTCLSCLTCGVRSDTDSFWAPLCFRDILGDFYYEVFTIKMRFSPGALCLNCAASFFCRCPVWFSPSCLVFQAASWRPSAKGCLLTESISCSSSKLPSVCGGSRRRIPTKPPPTPLLYGQTQRGSHRQI